jgi:general secretion pathway protein G
MVTRTMRRIRRSGFTLIELIVVMAILATLLTLAIPRYFASVDRSKEAVLKQNLSTVRDALDQFHSDTGKYPDTLDELVSRRYLRKPPFDPITESATTWVVVSPPADTKSTGIYDVKSGASGNASDGSAYADW